MGVWHYFSNDTNTYNCIMIVSALWHIDQGDYNYKKFQYISTRQQDIALSEENIGSTINIFSLCFSRAATGFGMLWAASGVYSLGIYLKAMVLYIGIQLLIWFCLGGSERFNEIRGH